MKCFLRLVLTYIVIIVITCVPLGVVQAKEIKYNHNSITITEIKGKVDFKVISPKQIPDSWTLEIKTYPWVEKDNINSFRLHYMDKNDENLMIGIEERKATPKEIEDKTPNKITINGNSGNFIEWGNSGEKLNGKIIVGGKLCWVQDGTYIEMDSSDISMDKMIKIANSMK
ncbi:DUF4367 domain-containing protein [Bacillus sp. AK128]